MRMMQATSKKKGGIMDKILGTVEAARRLGVSAGRVAVLIRGGRLPAQRIGRAWIIREADLELVADRPWGKHLKSEKPC